jgi:hypothetical protein
MTWFRCSLVATIPIYAPSFALYVCHEHPCILTAPAIAPIYAQALPFMSVTSIHA